MRKTLLLLIAAALTCGVFSQEDMAIVWEQKMGHKIIYHGTDLGNTESGFSFVASDKELTVFQNKDGKTIWTKAFKEIAPNLRKIDELLAFWKSNTIFLFDRKMGSDQIACINMDNGSLLWTTDKYQNLSEDLVMYIPEKDAFVLSLKDKLVFIKARTGEEVWSTAQFKGAVGQWLYLPEEDAILMVNFKPGFLASLFTGFKNQIMKVNAANGEVLWESTYIGRAERKAVTRDFVFDLEVINDKVILRLNGIQVYDLKTGANIWSAAYDYTADGLVGKPQGQVFAFGVYGAVADPLIVGDDFYVMEMSDKKSQYLKKYDVHTGQLIWTSPEIPQAKAIPGMYLVGDKIILQIGGKVEVQYHHKYRSGDSWVEVEFVGYEDVKPYGVKAFNVSDGKMAWESEKFRKGITNAIYLGNEFIVCSGKELHSINPENGEDKFVVPVNKGGVGLASLILPYNDDIVVVGEKGISKFKASNGDLVCNAKYKTSRLEARIGDILILKTDKADIACFDLSAGCSFAEFKAKTGAATTLTNDASHVYVYEDKVVTKVKAK